MLKFAWNMCHRKKRYSVRQANYVVQKVNERGGRQVHHYFCWFCKSRHIGGILDFEGNKVENDEKIEVLV